MAPPEVQIAAVSVKLPEFWPKTPATWFTQVEAQFQLGNVTADATKYFHVVAKLDQHTAIKVSDLLENPPEDEKYEALKKRLTESFSQTPLERAEALLNIDSLCDKKPSELADEMLSIAGTAINTECPLFTALFLRTLPLSVRQHLTADKETLKDLRKTAKRADQLCATAPEQGGIHRVEKQRVSREEKTLCYYHKRFGTKANKCKQPCSFVQDVQSVDVEIGPATNQHIPSSGNGPAGRC